MKTITKILCLVLCLVLLVGVFAACNSDETTDVQQDGTGDNAAQNEGAGGENTPPPAPTPEVEIGTSGLGFVLMGNTYEVSLGAVTETEEIVIPSTYKEKAVSKISDNAFKGYTDLKKITIPASVTEIGNNAFSGCNQLTAIAIPGSVAKIGSRAFENCAEVTTIEIGSGVKEIGEAAFSGCAKVTEIVVPDTVEGIGKNAFLKCDALTSITLPFVGDKRVEAENSTFVFLFDKATSVPTSLTRVVITGGTEIGNAAFRNCKNLKEIVLPEGIVNIGLNAFAGCTALEGITIPSSVTHIGNTAFNGCSALADIAISDNVLSIGKEAFKDTAYFKDDSKWEKGSLNVLYLGNYLIAATEEATSDYVFEMKAGTKVIAGSVFSGFKKMTAITIPNSVIGIGANSFEGCIGLTDLALSNSVKYIGESAFEGCTKFVTVIIPDSVEIIEKSAFADCTSLKSVTIGTGVTSIGSVVFSGCTAMESVTVRDGNVTYRSAGNCLIEIATKTLLYGCKTSVIPTDGSVEIIGDSAFEGCVGLTEIVIPNSVKKINKKVFKGCTSLESITIPFVGDGESETHFGYLFDLTTKNHTKLPASLKTVVITGGENIAKDAFLSCSKLESITLSDTLKSIGATAFKDCSGLKSLVIPAALESIGDNAFINCSGLAAITVAEGNAKYHSNNNCLIETESKTLVLGCKNSTIPDDGSVVSIGKGAFAGCSGLTQILLPNNITGIGVSAFDGCTGLTEIAIPSSVTVIEKSSFNGCSALVNVALPNTLTGIGESAFAGCAKLAEVTIPNTVTSIGVSAFASCSALTTITVPTSVTSIGKSAFEGCTGLTEMTLPFVGDGGTKNTNFGYIFNATAANQGSKLSKNLKTVVITGGTTIAEEAFKGCKYITTITLPDTVTTIGKSAFSGCSVLVAIEVPSAVTSIGDSAFSGCTKLATITLPDGLESIGKDAFKDTAYYKDASNWSGDVLYIGKHLIKANTAVSGDYAILAGTKTIADNAFLACTKLTTVTIPDGLLYVGKSAFSGCSALATVNFSESVVQIGDSAFDKCGKLTELTVPTSVTRIGLGAFSGCNALTKITLPFVGSTMDGTSNAHFGYIFGATSASKQKDYIPATLNTVVIQGGTTLAANAFIDCVYLTDITLSETLVSIGKNAFSGCIALPTITLPDTVKTIGASAFQKCTLLTSIALGDAVETIEKEAFKECTALKTIELPATVASIGERVFAYCSALESITVAEDNAKYHSAGNCLIATEAKTLVFGCKNSVIPADGTVTSIAKEAFLGCSTLTEIEIPTTVTTIGISAFMDCSGLTTITIPFVGTAKDVAKDAHFGYIFGAREYAQNVNFVPASLKNVIISGGKEIVENAFRGCATLESISIPASTTVIGKEAFYGCIGLTSLEVKEENPIYHSEGNCLIETAIKTLIFGCQTSVIPADGSVTIIGEGAFAGCSTLKEIVIPDAVTLIGKKAFKDCSGLESITVPFVGAEKDGIINTFFGYIFGATSYSMNSATVPASLKNVKITSDKKIAAYAFSGCSTIESISIPASVVTIEAHAFNDCYGLKAMTVEAENPKYHSEGNCLIETATKTLILGCQASVIPNDGSVTTIGEGAFYGCRTLTSIVIPSSVTTIAKNAFWGCSGMESVTIGIGVETIGERAFAYCGNLKTITVENGNAKYHSAGNCLIETAAKKLVLGCPTSVFPLDGSVTSIGDDAFFGCTGLTSIAIPEVITSIGKAAFGECTNLVNITLPFIGEKMEETSNTHFGYIFGADSGFNNGEYVPTSLKNVSIIGGTTISSHAFYGCNELTSISLPNSITSIGSYAFAYCKKLTNMIIPEGVTSIENGMFWYCEKLESITIPSGITNIGAFAFAECNALKTINFQGTEAEWRAIQKADAQLPLAVKVNFN